MAQAVAPAGSVPPPEHAFRSWIGRCRLLASLCALLLATMARAGGAPPAPSAGGDEPQGYGSPAAVLRHFVQSMRDADMDTAIRCMDLQAVPPAVRDEIGERFALQLALVLERVPPAKLEEVAGEDTVTLLKTEAGDIAFRRRTNAAGDRVWQFSPRTVDAMPRIFREMVARPVLEPSAASADAGGTHVEPMQWRAPEVALWLSLPHWLKRQALGLELYQWLGLPLVALLGWLIARMVEAPIHALLTRMGGMEIVQLPEWPVILRRCTSAAAWTVALQSAAWLMLLLGLPLALLDPLFLGVQVANLVLVTRLVLQLIDFTGAWLRSHDHARRGLRAMDDLLVASLSRVGKIAVVTGALVWLVSIVGAESSLNRLLAGLGIGGLAFALALQEPLRNFFSSLVLAADRPFSVGDTLAFDGVSGKVEEVGFRTTTLRTRLDTRLVVPNATIVSAKLETHPGNAFKEFRAVLPIAFHADPAAIAAFKERAAALVASAPGVREKGQDIGVSALGVNGIEFTVVALFSKSEQSFTDVFDALHMRLLAAAREAGLPLRERMPG